MEVLSVKCYSHSHWIYNKFFVFTHVDWLSIYKKSTLYDKFLKLQCKKKQNIEIYQNLLSSCPLFSTKYWWIAIKELQHGIV